MSVEQSINSGYQEFIKFKRGLPHSMGVIATAAPYLLHRSKLPEISPYEQQFNSLPLRVQEYVEVGKMIDSHVYPLHKQTLLRETRSRLFEVIQQDELLMNSLIKWGEFVSEQARKQQPDRKNRPQNH